MKYIKASDYHKANIISQNSFVILTNKRESSTATWINSKSRNKITNINFQNKSMEIKNIKTIAVACQKITVGTTTSLFKGD